MVPSALHAPYPCQSAVYKEEAIDLLRRFYARGNAKGLTAGTFHYPPDITTPFLQRPSRTAQQL